LVPSEKVLIMPSSSERSARLRRDEDPPYPEYAVAILRSALDIHQEMEGMKHAVEALEATTNQQGAKLDAIAEIALAVKSLQDTSGKQSGKIENLEGEVQLAKGTLTAFKWIGAIAVVLFTALEIYKHFLK
jgi:hypothetical protein